MTPEQQARKLQRLFNAASDPELFRYGASDERVTRLGGYEVKLVHSRGAPIIHRHKIGPLADPEDMLGITALAAELQRVIVWRRFRDRAETIQEVGYLLAAICEGCNTIFMNPEVETCSLHTGPLRAQPSEDLPGAQRIEWLLHQITLSKRLERERRERGEHHRDSLRHILGHYGLPGTQPPPIAAPTCSFCGAEKLEVFFTSKRDGKTACQKCFGERQDQHLAKEVPE